MPYTASQPGTAQHTTTAISIKSDFDGGPAGPCKGTQQHTAAHSTAHTQLGQNNMCSGIRAAEQTV
jgi:hypothetical protein